MSESNAIDSELQSRRHDEADDERCLVCNDMSTGYHYGTPSCNGCKTFFRRTVIKKQAFVCQYGGRCIIDKSVRCACRHCRFEKCVAVGMSKDAIQQNRDPIGYTKRTRRYPPVKQVSASRLGVDGGAAQVSSTTSVGMPLPLSFSSQNSLHDLTMETTITNATAEQAIENQVFKDLSTIENRVRIIRESAFRNSEIFVQQSFCETMLQPSILFNADFINVQSKFPHKFEEMRRVKDSDYQYWHERDWMIMIEWAKTIPVYETLSFSDKLALLRHSAISYPSLNQCFYTKFVDSDTIVFPDGSFFDRTPEIDRPASFQRKKIKVLNNLLKPIRKMEMDAHEFAAAKAIFFLNADADDLSMEVRPQVSEARRAITNALYRYMTLKERNNKSVDRFAKLLLLGTAISTIVVETKEAVVVANFFEQIQFSRLAKQLLLNMKEDELEVSENSQPSSTNNSSIITNANSSFANNSFDDDVGDSVPAKVDATTPLIGLNFPVSSSACKKSDLTYLATESIKDKRAPSNSSALNNQTSMATASLAVESSALWSSAFNSYLPDSLNARIQRNPLAAESVSAYENNFETKNSTLENCSAMLSNAACNRDSALVSSLSLNGAAATAATAAFVVPFSKELQYAGDYSRILDENDIKERSRSC